MSAIGSRRAALLAVAVVVALLLGGCGGRAAKPTATPTAAGQTVRGTGYSVRLPTGWSDMTAEQRELFTEKIDLALAGPKTQGFMTNLNVMLRPSQGATLTDWAVQGREGIVQVLGARLVGPVERRGLAGAPAMAFEYTYTMKGPLHSRMVVCLRSGMAYLVTFTAYPQAFTADRAAFDQILSSWSWG